MLAACGGGGGKALKPTMEVSLEAGDSEGQGEWNNFIPSMVVNQGDTCHIVCSLQVLVNR